MLQPSMAQTGDKAKGGWSKRGLAFCVLPIISCAIFLLIAWLVVLPSLHDNPTGTAYDQLTSHWTMHCFTASVVLLAIFNIIYFIYWNKNRKPGYKEANRFILQIALAAWLLGPPIYFIIEFWQFYHGPYDGAPYEMFKVGQDLATKLWAAILVLLLGIYKDWLPP
jgi:hypothetical protein